MEYSPSNIKNKFEKIDSRTLKVSDLPLEFQGSTVAIDFDDVNSYRGPFVVKYFLTSEFIINFNDSRHLVNPWDGFSHLLHAEEKRLLEYRYRYPEDKAELRNIAIELKSVQDLLRCIIMTVPEENIDVAIDISSKICVGILDVICLHKRIPLQIQRIEVLTNVETMLRSYSTMPYLAVELDIDQLEVINDIPRAFRPCLTLYREAINSCNPYYRLLCLYKISERLKEIQTHNMTELLNKDPGFKRSRIVIPDNELTRLYFEPYIGKNLNHFLVNHVRAAYRNNIAHFSLSKGSFDAEGNMILPPADNKINTIVEATNTVLVDRINVAIKEEIEIMKKYDLEREKLEVIG
jgi:hypothetical protein